MMMNRVRLREAQTRLTVEEVARIALSNYEMRYLIAEKLDLSDEEIDKVSNYLEDKLNG